MPAELLPRLFDVFVQAPQTLARGVGGLGLGLTVVRKVAEGEWEILNLAVAPSFRRQGIGRQLLGDALAGRQGIFFLEVRESNVAARRLYSQAGFKMVTQRLQYYANPVETGVVMKLHS